MRIHSLLGAWIDRLSRSLRNERRLHKIGSRTAFGMLCFLLYRICRKMSITFLINH